MYSKCSDTNASCPQTTPPPYPGGDMLSHSPGQASSDFGVDPMEESEGEYYPPVAASKCKVFYPAKLRLAWTD